MNIQGRFPVRFLKYTILETTPTFLLTSSIAPSHIVVNTQPLQMYWKLTFWVTVRGQAHCTSKYAIFLNPGNHSVK